MNGWTDGQTDGHGQTKKVKKDIPTATIHFQKSNISIILTQHESWHLNAVALCKGIACNQR